MQNPWRISIGFDPDAWTIDKERDVFLNRSFQDRDESDLHYFVLYFRGILIPIKLREHWDYSKSPRVWELISIKIPGFLRGQEEELIECLREALITYAIDGSPNENFNKQIAIEFDFDLSRVEIGGELK